MVGPKMSSQALASLTATYTDSEGEEEADEDHENQGSVTVHSQSPNNASPSDSKSTPSSRPPSPVVKVTAKRQQLVSYHDDTIVSDEEGDTEKHQIVIVAENESLENIEMEVVDGEFLVDWFVCGSAGQIVMQFISIKTTFRKIF